MNKQNINRIFAKYIDKFEEFNNKEHDENFKWVIAKEFRVIMDDALSMHGQDFADALYKAKVCSYKFIDAYTQPFYGMVVFARHEPETVRQMFLDLYSDYNDDLRVLQNIISKFIDLSTKLLEKYSPGGFLYKQDYHAVSGYLFLYNPERYYMYKSDQSHRFADCIEFYDDWGSGNNIKLDVYYRMCDWAIEQINNSPELLATNQSRYNLPNSKEMAPDVSKHILLFDLIYCCDVYDLFDGISFVHPNAKEKQLIVEKRKKADALYIEYSKALEVQHKYDEALSLLRKYLVPNTVIIHAKYGKCIIQSCDFKCQIKVLLENGDEKELSAKTLFAKGLARTKTGELEQHISCYVDYLENEKAINAKVKITGDQYKPYEEYCSLKESKAT